MKESLKPGLTTTRRVEIDAPRTIEFMGEALRVYATPELVRDIEYTCRTIMLEHGDEDEDSVGVLVNVSHSGATPLDSYVDITATVAQVEGRRVIFDVSVRDPVEEVAKGQHGRFMVSIDRLRQGVADKIAKLAAI